MDAKLVESESKGFVFALGASVYWRINAVIVRARKLLQRKCGQMHMYLIYAREHWMKPGENPPVGLILCAERGAAEAHYALDNLPNKVLAAEYQTALPDEKLIADELDRSRKELENRKKLANGDT